MFKTPLLIVVFSALLFAQSDLKFEYSAWLAGGGINTDQTSGIAFIGRGEGGEKKFLLADDIGDIYMMTLSRGDSIGLRKFSYSEEVNRLLEKLPKKDIEEITFDRTDGSVFISIEGNMPLPVSSLGIYKVIFRGGNVSSLYIEKLEQISFHPEEKFTEYIQNNIGYEGICADEKYFYLGLEGFQKGRFFADSTVIYLADKKTHEIVRKISTREAGIGTICGLYAEGNGVLWVIDRNSARVIRIKIEGDRIVKEFQYNVTSRIPDTENTGYTMALESITLDDEGFIYCVDDPWRTFYIPSADVLKSLTSRTVENFKKYIPIIYKLRIIQ